MIPYANDRPAWILRALADAPRPTLSSDVPHCPCGCGFRVTRGKWGRRKYATVNCYPRHAAQMRRDAKRREW